MFDYHQVKAVEAERFRRHSHEAVAAGRRHVSLRQLLAALAGRLNRLGMREGKGKTRPASPAY